jgi:peptidoglycan/LPS O-acetylase OafA/YrhL
LISPHFKALLQRLGRITSSSRFIPEIDGLRFVAIAAVVFYHVNGYVSQHTPLGQASFTDPLAIICSKGNFGVTLFFVISGFILSLPFARHYLLKEAPVNLSAYYLRRLTRIEPPYLIALFVHLLMLLLYKHEILSKLLPHLAASIFYLHNVIYRAPSTICAVAWSLEIEVQYYLLAPLFTRVFAISNQPLRRGILSLGIVALSALANLTPPTLSLLHFFQYFLVGFLLADFYIMDWGKKSEQPLLWNLAGGLAWTILLLLLASEAYVPLVAPWCVLLAYMAAFRGTLWQAVFRQPLLTTIGGMCYTIYLYHMLIMSAFARYTTQLVWTDQYWALLISQLTILFPIIIIVSSIIFIVTEQPFMRKDILMHWRRQF